MTNQPPPNPGVALDIRTEFTNPITMSITSSGSISVALKPIADGLVSPLVGTATASMPGALFVADQPGQVWKVDLATGAKSTFLDVSASLVPLGAFGDFDERGLLGFAFHPDYATNGFVYTYQSEPVQGAPTFTTTMPAGTDPNHQSVIAQWTVDNPGDPNSVVNPASKRVLMRVDQPQFNHNGGQLAFGPDNMLYIAIGDGGGADDADGQQFINGPITGHGPTGNGRDATNPLGTILRIDPLGSNSANGEYGIPADNPFVAADDDRVDEIFAYGFRNVFRFSFDPQNGDLYAGDVGQNDIEEVDVVTAGGNYGWNYKEGSFFFNTNGNEPGFVTADPGGLPTDLIDPIAEYDHDEGLSVIGGYVYSGTQVAALNGRYVFGDWSGDFSSPLGRLFYLDTANEIREFQISNRETLGIFLNGFGRDISGELYLLGNSTGTPATTSRTGIILQIVTPDSYPVGSLPYTETTDGDLSGNRLMPNQFALALGENQLTATSVQGDIEYFSVTIPKGTVLDSIILSSYDSADDQSFIGIQSGHTFTEPPTDTNPANLLGYLVFGAGPGHVGTDILDNMGSADNAIGFSGPLPSGIYTVWSQEIGPDEATYRLNFVVDHASRILLPLIQKNATE
ncbi:PQQ-dependent sugar dehydrogenase [Chloroflexi bacterium TSY]|nr:PQQ-dependent sugar dehydrogenase [Chloroflexi bacterium TSY]